MSDILRYRGDITATCDRDHMIGPDFGKRYLAVRSLAYDPVTDLTTATLRGILPDEFRERITVLMARQQEYDRIKVLFNAHTD